MYEVCRELVALLDEPGEVVAGDAVRTRRPRQRVWISPTSRGPGVGTEDREAHTGPIRVLRPGLRPRAGAARATVAKIRLIRRQEVASRGSD